MLPDFIHAKKELKQRVTSTLRTQRDEQLGKLSEVPEVLIPEGDRLEQIRPDGSHSFIEFKKLSVEVSIPTSDLNDPSAILKEIRRVAEEMAAKEAGLIYEGVGRAAEEVDNVISAEGKPLSPDLLFKAIERLELDFDESRKPIFPTLHVHPSKYEMLMNVLREIKEDPVHRKTSKNLLDRKREEWRAREGNRKLVG